MISSKGVYTGLFVLIAAILLVAGFRGITVGQSSPPAAAAAPAPQKESLVRLSAPAGPATDATLKPMAASAFLAAAEQNSQLQTSLQWVFGGRSQRGWNLYASLISNMIGDEKEDGASADFASALSRWQKVNRIDSRGVLDNYTWSQMVSTFQSQRLRSHTYPSADQLVTLNPSECYDPSRPEQLRQVERETYQAYKRMLRAAAADTSLGLEVAADGELSAGEKYLKVISAFRSREYQENLRKQSPNSGRAGLAVNSPHFTGRALDIYVGGEPVSTKDENRAIQTRTKAYRWLVKNASRFGFRPYFYEPWHWEYVGK
jgi:zinc D-Ala-D-Ala carboxypeptidase